MRDIKTPIFRISVSSGAIKPDSMRRKIKHSNLGNDNPKENHL